MFLLVCEEMSFSAAARRAFVTQQCLSDHIRRLEESSHVRLFERRPKLCLTPAGQAMRRTLLQMQGLEDALNEQLGQYSEGTRGEIHFGINSGRSGVLLPRVFPAFHARFPHVKLFVVNRETREMEKMLAEGTLDTFLGINTHLNEAFRVTPLGRERLYLAVPACLLRQKYGSAYPACLNTLHKGANLKDFEEIPFVERALPSTITECVHQFCLRSGVCINNMLNINDFPNQLELCSLFPAALIAPAMILPQIQAHNHSCPEEQAFHVFPIQGLTDTLSIDLLSRAGDHTPPYTLALEQEVIRQTQLLNAAFEEIPLP